MEEHAGMANEEQKTFKNKKELIKCINSYLQSAKKNGCMATEQGFCCYCGITMEKFYSIAKKYPKEYDYVKNALFSAAVNAPRHISPTIVKAIIDNKLHTYDAMEMQYQGDGKVIVEMPKELEEHAQ